MKYLLLFLISFSAFANYALRSEIESKSVGKVYLKKPKTGDYLRLPSGYHKEYYKVIDEMINDIDQPIYEAKSNVVACAAVVDDPATTEIDETKTQEEDCLEKQAAQVCDGLNGYFVVRLEDNSEVYCTKLLGYVEVPSGNKIVVEDATLKAAYESAKATEAATEAAIKAKYADMAAGKRIYALVKISSDMKGLTKGQRKQLKTDLAKIKVDLLDGDLCIARDGIAALTANGTTILQSDIDNSLAAIDAIKTCQ